MKFLEACSVMVNNKATVFENGKIHIMMNQEGSGIFSRKTSELPWVWTNLSEIDIDLEWNVFEPMEEKSYTEFMAWYCSTSSVGKKYRVYKHERIKGPVSLLEINNHNVAPKVFTECYRFQVQI